MGICTQCGTIVHKDDLADHVCDASAIPAQGTENRPVKQTIVRINP